MNEWINVWSKHKMSRNENDKNTNFMMKNNKTNAKKVFKSIKKSIFSWTRHTGPWCNMLQTLRRKYTGAILLVEHIL